MSELLWDFGVCHCKANHLDIVRHGKIEPKVESVGVIEAWDYMTFTEDTREYLYFLSSRILRSSGTSASEFCHALDRVLTPLDRKALYTKWNTSFRSARKLLESSSDPEQLEAKLDELVALECIAQTTKSRAPAIMEDIDTMLKLEYSETNCKDNRKDITRAETEWYYTKHGRPMEGVARVRCKFCARRSIFHLTCWELPTVDHLQVYRVPGLLHGETVLDGTGLIMSGNKIIGKMAYRTPACQCHRLERVEVGSDEFPL